MAEKSLKERTVTGVGWSMVDNASSYAVSFIVSVILARILSPDDYGLLGIIAVFTAICDTLINGGFSSALLRKKHVSEDDYNTVFIVNVGMSILMYSIIFFSAPLIARFFNREELLALTRVQSIGIVIGSFTIVQGTRLTKMLDFKSLTKITLIASITSGVIGIVLAILGFGVWALVVQNLCLQSLRAVFLWIFNKWSPRLKFVKHSFVELFGFGWKLMVSGLLDTVWNKMNQVVVGKFYSPASLGQYTRAGQLSAIFSCNVCNVVQRVTYPVLSDIQDEKERLVSAYRRIIKTTMFVTAICMFALGSVSDPLLYCLIGPQWHEAATYLPLICIIESLYPLHAINLNMLQIQGRSDLYLGLEVAKKIVCLAPLLTGIFVGIMPMLYVGIGAGIICYFMNAYFPGKILGYGPWEQLKDIAPSYGIASVVALSVWFLKYLPISNWIILPIQVVVGLCVLLLLCKVTKLEEYEDAKGMLLQYARKILKK